ncbi:MAG TPA: hypothetical protein VF235_07225 [Actinomycetota bacterium]
MEPAVGVVVIGAAALLLVATWLPLRPRLSRRTADICSATAGAAIGFGGLLLLTDVGAASWILTPPFLALCAVVHRRALFAGDGPLRV